MARCPICRKAEPSTEHKPFCSRRCADQDLLGWLSDKYAVPGEEAVSRDRPSDDDED